MRNGLNFTERGFGPRGGVGCSDRGHTAVSQLQPGDVDWEHLFGGAGQGRAGSTPAASSARCPRARRRSRARRWRRRASTGPCVSYDLNYRDSLWRSVGGKAQAREVNRSLMPFVDVLFGNEEDFSAALGFELRERRRRTSSALPTAGVPLDDRRGGGRVPEHQDGRHHAAHVALGVGQRLGRHLLARGRSSTRSPQRDVEILDRVGGGDSFASGFIYGLLAGKDPQWALECGVAHGALAMSTPGDTTMATFAEVMRAMKGSGTRIDR